MAGRGQSGVRMWKKAAIIKPVEPEVGEDGFRQPPYLRSHSAAQTAKFLKVYQSFIRRCMHEKKKAVGKFSGRPEVQKAFKECADAWWSSPERRKNLKYRKAGRKSKKAKASEYDFEEAGDEDIFWE